MLAIYNSLSGETEELVPARKGKITMYVCGVTPYDYCHLGHARTYAAFDTIKNWLGHCGYGVYCVQNVTDVEDKIINRAKQTGTDPLELAAKFDAESRKEFGALGIGQADVYPKVTENMPEIIGFIKGLVENSHAYANETGVYFEISKFQNYGRLSRQRLEMIKHGARIEVDEKKRDPADFALWKVAKPGELAFESPWGAGRPGWHIECSAMSTKFIEGTIDIHGGARDLIFPHHENEIAQSEALSGKKFVKYWMHTGFLTVNGEKMAKSLGNFITIKDALLKFKPYALRMFFAQTHYRSPIDYSEKELAAAQKTAENLFEFAARAGEFVAEKPNGPQGVDADYEKEVEGAKAEVEKNMCEDFDTPRALAAVFDLARLTNGRIATKGFCDYQNVAHARDFTAGYLDLIGVRNANGSQERFTSKSGQRIVFGENFDKNALETLVREIGLESGKDAKAAVEELLELREASRKAKDYKKADAIRAGLAKAGIKTEDI